MEEEKLRLKLADEAREVIAMSEKELKATILTEANHDVNTYDELERRLSIMKYLDKLVVKDLREIFE